MQKNIKDMKEGEEDEDDQKKRKALYGKKIGKDGKEVNYVDELVAPSAFEEETANELGCLWPNGAKNQRFNELYQYWMFPHQIYIIFFFLVRFAFENGKPPWSRIITEFWLDFVYLIDMIRIFTSPFQNINGRIVHNKKQIAFRYLRSRFILDVFGFLPLGYLRYKSEWSEGSLDE